MKKALMRNLFVLPRPALAVFTASVAALGSAMVLQFGFDLEPCVLCLWQRAPYAVAAMVSLMACVWRPYHDRRMRIFMGFCAAAFFAGAAIAAFHTGVERHWWLGTEGCAIKPLHGATPADLRAELLGMASARCDEIRWTFLGLTLANWNVPLSLALGGFSLMAAFRWDKNTG